MILFEQRLPYFYNSQHIIIMKKLISLVLVYLDKMSFLLGKPKMIVQWLFEKWFIRAQKVFAIFSSGFSYYAKSFILSNRTELFKKETINWIFSFTSCIDCCLELQKNTLWACKTNLAHTVAEVSYYPL